MLQNILKINGVTELQKDEQSQIKGKGASAECSRDSHCNVDQVCQFGRCQYFS